MEFKTGMVIEITKWISKQYKDCEDTVERATINKITRRSGKTRLKVTNEYGTNFTIIPEHFIGQHGEIKEVGA